MNSDRNLLFGIIALQMDFIDRDQLVKAMHDWVLDKSKPLGEIIVANNAMEPRNRDLLEQMVARHIEVHGGDSEKSLASVSSIGSVREELEQIGASDLTASLHHLTTHRSDDRSKTKSHSVGRLTSEGTRFQILRPHAKGGLGQILVAHDEELKREVALKEIQEHHADHPDNRSRFTIEAEITGGLEHPGIVPVYGLGQYDDGRPFYVMRFIRGDSLKEAIERYHLTGDQDSLNLRKLLGRFIDVCNAIQYAHSRGVLHRDLKPGNIMLGKYGETLVVDWGLAKTLGKSDKHADEQTLLPTSSGDSSPTQMGSAIGTPGYMSPEQAAGRLDEIGPASDVYSLGATLYTLLTGKPPFAGKQPGEVLRKVELGVFPRPRDVATGVAPALEAICLKAMALQPEDRYESPGELVEDLEHWLADESVSACAEPMTVRTRRWMRKHPRTMAALGASILFGLSSAIVIAAVVSGKNRQLASFNERLLTANEAERRATQQTQQSLYLAQINLAASAWEAGNIAQLARLLDRAGPESDRGFEWRYLSRLARPELVIYNQHDREVKAIALSSDGELAASGDTSGWLRIWNVGDGQTLFSVKAGKWELNSVSFSPSGRTVAVAGHLGYLALWDVESQQELRKFAGHGSQVFDVAFSPDGETIASAGADMTVRIWDAQTATQRHVARGHHNMVFTVSFSPDGTQLASGGQDGTVRIWNVENGVQAQELKGTGAFVNEVAFSPDGNLVAAVHELRWGGEESKTDVVVWKTETGAQLLAVQPQKGSAHAVAFSPDSRFVATGADDGSIHLINLSSQSSDFVHRGHTGRVWDVTFSANGLLLASCGSDGTARIRSAFTEPRSTAIVPSLNRQGAKVTFLPSGELLAIGDESGAELRKPFSGDQVRRFRDPDRGATLNAACVAVNAVGTRIAALSSFSQEVVSVWEIETGNLVFHLEGHGDIVTDVIFSSDEQYLSTASRDRKVRIWDANTGKLLSILDQAKFQVLAIDFNQDGRLVAAGSAERIEPRDGRGKKPSGELLVWDWQSGQPPRRFGSDDTVIRDVAFSPGGSRLAAGRADGVIDLWDVETAQLVDSLPGHSGEVSSLQFFPEGSRLVSGGQDQSVRVWDLRTGEQFLDLRGHRHGVDSVCVSPDGNHIISASSGILSAGEVLLWETGATQDDRIRQMRLTYRPEWYRRQLRAAGEEGNLFAARWHAAALDTAEPNNAQHAIACARAMLKLKQLAEADRWAERAIRRDPRHVDSYKLRGKLLEQMGKTAEAISVYLKCADLSPKDARLRYGIGNLQREADQLESSAEMFGEAARIDPKFAEAFCNRGQVLVRLGLFDEAIEALETGHELGTARNTRQPGIQIMRPPWRYPSAQWLSDAKGLKRLDPLLDTYLEGRRKPDGVKELSLLIRLCYIRKRHPELLELAKYLEGEKPEDPLILKTRVLLARSLLRASATRTGIEARELRKEALEVLEAMVLLAGGSGNPAMMRFVASEIAAASECRNLRSDSSALTPDEQAQWRSLWLKIK